MRFSFAKAGSVACAALLGLLIACSKTSSDDPTPPANPCNGVTVAVTATVTNAAPGQSNGSISASATGGSGFTFSKDGTNFASSGTFGNLAAGTYTITAKNSNGCTGSAQFTVGVLNPCAGVTITVTATPTGATANQSNGSIAASATGGTAPYTFSKDGGANYQATGTFTALAAGNYTITVKDANGCTGTSAVTVPSINPCNGVTIAVTATSTNTTGTGSTGSVSVSATGGTGPYTFSINNGTFQTAATFNNLAAGNYAVTAKDANGCTGTTNATVGTNNPCAGVSINFSSTVQTATPCVVPVNGSILLSVSGGTAPYTFSFNNGQSFQASNTASGLSAGAYGVQVRDANGCTSANSNVAVGITPMGSLFTQVRSIIQANCAVSGCHDAGTQQNGINFTNNCDIVSHADRIKVRAVDQAGTPSQMPQPPRAALSATERAAITNWVNAGGGYGN